MLHHGYASQVLRGRGVQPPPKEQIAAYLASLTGDVLAQETGRLRRIALGVDNTDDVPCLLAAIRNCTSTAPPPSTAVDRREHPAAHKSRAAAPAPSPRTDPHTDFLRSNGVHVYGATAALKIELDAFGGGAQDRQAGYTVQIEGARKEPGSGYAWQRKIQFQLTRRELPLMAAFLVGYGGPSIEFANHGPAHDKSLSVMDQGRRLYVRLRQPGCTIPVPIEPPDVYAWGEICMLALQLNRPSLGTEAQLVMLRRIGRMTTASGEAS